MIEFVFMLTHNDATVPNAADVLAEVRDAGLRYVGFKDVGATPEELRAVTDAAHDAGLEVMLEVVSVSPEDERRSLEAASGIDVDWVLGGTHPEVGEAVLASAAVRYCPFPGRVEGHPSVLLGAPEEIAEHARALTARAGVHGVDLLAYRHPEADHLGLVRAVVEAADGPVIVAGSIVSLDQVRALDAAGAWGFTIGGAIFEGRLPGGPDVGDQVRRVVEAARGSEAPA